MHDPLHGLCDALTFTHNYDLFDTENPVSSELHADHITLLASIHFLQIQFNFHNYGKRVSPSVSGQTALLY